MKMARATSYVKFNLEKLPSLTGFEKIELLRDMHQCRMTSESFKVYDTCYKNDLIDRLKYIDHHNMFHLLIKEPKKYKNNILQVWQLMQVHYKPSVHLYQEMIRCCQTWNDLQLASQLIERLKEQKLTPTTAILNSILKLSSSSIQSTQDALKYYDEIKDVVQPDWITFCRLMELQALIYNPPACHRLYSTAMRTCIPSWRGGLKKKPLKMHQQAIVDQLTMSYLSALVNSRESPNLIMNTYNRIDWD